MSTLEEQLKIAKKLLKEVEGKLMPDDSFFDAEVSAFESKINKLLLESLEGAPLSIDQKERVAHSFIQKFNKHIMSMTPISIKRNK